MENERKWRKIRFAKNLVALIEGTGLDRKAFAGRAGVPYPWLQRATTQGITRLDHRGREHLDRIARWFGLADPERLWDRDFVAPPPWDTREAHATRIAEDLRRLVLERGVEVEPIGTVLRLIREAKDGGAEGTANRAIAPPEVPPVARPGIMAGVSVTDAAPPRAGPTPLGARLRRSPKG